MWYKEIVQVATKTKNFNRNKWTTNNLETCRLETSYNVCNEENVYKMFATLQNHGIKINTCRGKINNSK